jgi:DNA invertase Pin-like site-specific DNA recombinase
MIGAVIYIRVSTKEQTENLSLPTRPCACDEYCRTHKGTVHFLVVQPHTLRGEKYDHFALRAHLKSLGISLRSATEPIDDTSTGKLMEGVLAAVRAIRQRRPIGSNARGHEGRARTRTMDVPGAARLPQCAEVVEREAAASAAVLSGRRGVRGKSVQSNRRNDTTFQVLGAV